MERGEESMELLEEISESERFRLRTIVAVDVDMFGLGGVRLVVMNGVNNFEVICNQRGEDYRDVKFKVMKGLERRETTLTGASPREPCPWERKKD